MAELADSIRSSTDDRLDQAEALVRSYCGWHIAPSRTETVALPETWAGTVVLPSLYVTAINGVYIDGVLAESTAYAWTPAGVLTRVGYLYWGPGDLEVTIRHGYSTVPPEVAGIVQSIAQRAVNNPGSLVRTQAGPFADTYSQTGFNQSLPLALLDAEKAVLDRYKLPPRP